MCIIWVMRKCASWEGGNVMVLKHVLVSFKWITVFGITPYLHFAQSGHSYFTAELTATLKTLTTRSHSTCAGPGSGRSNHRLYWSTRHEITVKWSDWQTCALTEQMTSETTGLTGIAGFESRQRPEIFLFSKMSRPALGPAWPPIQRVRGVISRGKMAGAWSWSLSSKSA
jgi:hypothetical protein